MKPLAKNRGGRPRKAKAKPGDRIQLGVRVTNEIKARLDGAAKDSGRSLSQEAEFRIERSFERENLLYETFEIAYGRQLAGLLMAAAGAMQYAMTVYGMATHIPGQSTGPVRPQSEGLLRDPAVYQAASDALQTILKEFAPAEPTSIPQHVADRLAAAGWTNVGEQAAKEILFSLRNPYASADDSWTTRVRTMLAGLAGAADTITSIGGTWPPGKPNVKQK